jgi:hypothetical protein
MNENTPRFKAILKDLLLTNENDYNQQRMDDFLDAKKYGLNLFYLCCQLLLNISPNNYNEQPPLLNKNNNQLSFSKIKVNTIKNCKLLHNQNIKQDEKDEKDDTNNDINNENFWLAMNYTLKALLKINCENDPRDYLSFIKNFARFFFEKKEEKEDEEYQENVLAIITNATNIDIENNGNNKITITNPYSHKKITIDFPLLQIQHQIEKSINKEESKQQ